MKPLPTACPFCEGGLVIESVRCRQCDTSINGHFTPSAGAEFEEEKLPVLRRLARLSADQLQLLEGFIRCEGKLNRLQEEVGMSYPTLRARLDELIADLGFPPRESSRDEAAPDAPRTRRQILDELQAGKISADEAAKQLRAARP